MPICPIIVTFFLTRFTQIKNMLNQISRIHVTAKNFAPKANFFSSRAPVSSLLNKDSMVLPCCYQHPISTPKPAMKTVFELQVTKTENGHKTKVFLQQ